MRDREHESAFFREFRPKHDSPYREGFEYLDYIARKLDPRCTVRALLIATDIDLGIAEDTQGRLELRLELPEIRDRLLDSRPDWRCSDRLRAIAELVYGCTDAVQDLMQESRCPTDCRRSGCPLESFVEERLDWRIS